MKRGLLLMAAIVCAACGTAASEPAPCASESVEPFVFVSTAAHRMWLCQAGAVKHEYPVRLGHGGVGKTREGDGKVPLGAYALGKPRPSAQFGTFVPIGYPSDVQRAQGYTGSAVGIHGPNRRLRWMGSWLNALDTTAGCVGVARDAEMSEIAEWLERVQAMKVVLK